PATVARGVSAGLSRGFDAFGWPPSDVVSQNLPLETDRLNWRVEAGRRPGPAVVTDALQWARRRAPEGRIFLWGHPSGTAPPYASDQPPLRRVPGDTHHAPLSSPGRAVPP